MLWTFINKLFNRRFYDVYKTSNLNVYLFSFELYLNKLYICSGRDKI